MNPGVSGGVDKRVLDRFVPAETGGQLIEAEQLARYWWAAQLVEGRRVLDVGCGRGLGTNMLASAGAVASTGVDVAEAIVEAAAASGEPNATFQLVDLRDLPFEDGSFGLITCFDVMEQVDEPSRVLRELARVLDDSGLVAMSSTNGVIDHPPESLETELRAVFDHVALYRQHNWIGSAVLREDEARREELEPLKDLAVGKAVGVELDSELFTVVLAGNAMVPEPAQVMVLTGLADLRKWSELWQQQQDLLTRQHEQFQALASRQDEVTRLREELRRSEAALAELPELELAAAEGRHAIDELFRLRREVDELRGIADRVYRSASWRITKPLRAAKRVARRG